MKNPYSRVYTSLYRGVVEDNIDPEKLGRCKIRIPSVHGALNYPVSILPWSRPLVLSPIGSKRGTVNIPDVGDIVWVLFEGANKEFPIYLGGTYAKDDLDIDNDIVDFYIEEDNRISYHRKERKYNIKIGDNEITLSSEGISLKGKVNIEGDLTVKNNLNVLGSLTKGE